MNRQRGAALLVILLIVGALAAYFAISALNSGQAERDQKTANTLAQAKEALIGFAATYRDTHPDQVFGFLPCPGDGNGIAVPPCSGQNVSVAGRLPWNTLGLPPLRDSSAECLWYALSGRAKDNPTTTTLAAPFSTFNWDTVGQFNIVESGTGNLLAGSTAPVADATWHNRPLAVILAPRGVIGGQTRPPAGVTECGGSGVLAAYLEEATISPAASALSTITLSTSNSVQGGINNDMGLWITSNDIFGRLMQRTDFRGDINTLLDDIALYLKGMSAASLPAATGSKGTDTLLDNYRASLLGNPLKVNFLDNWRDNLLYTRPIGATTVDGGPCVAVLFFGGARTPTQSRANDAQKQIAANYLEGSNATTFPNAGAYTGSATLDPADPTRDLVRCITGSATPPTPATTVSFANDFSAFTPAGSGVTVNGAAQSVGVTNSPTNSGGCFWYPLSIPLAGKTMRAYYDFQFMIADDYALTGKGNDRGYGFTFQMLNTNAGPPVSCGSESNMGILDGSNMSGMFSFIFETDVHRKSSIGDPAANHSAIMLNGAVDHTLSGSMSAACNGTASGCSHSPANKFEELPQPGAHNQRIEITTGCNATCSTCVPSVPNTHARLTAWVDCAGCNDVTTNLDRIAKPPTIQRCEPLDSSLNSFYFGLTGGFRNGSGAQGVTIRNLRLQTD